MKYTSRFFKDVDDCLAAAGNLTAEDNFDFQDRQTIANFYNGRELMTEQEAEAENAGNVINHLFGYNAMNGFKLQLGSIYNSGEWIWGYELDEQADQSTKKQHETSMSNKMDEVIKRSRRLRPEWNGMAGEAVLHGRSVLMFKDNYDWCPQIGMIYVPKRTGQSSTEIPYAMVPDHIPFYKLKEHLRNAEANPELTKWDVTELRKAINHLEKTGALTVSPQSDKYSQEHDQQTENSDEQMGTDESTAMVLPVWYVYEVNHDKPLLPVDMKVITRYDVVEAAKDGDPERPSNALIFSEDEHFKQISHFVHPVFMDTEIGGRPTWHSVTGIGRLNYERDGDIEEFFNLAMDGAKDKMRTKWRATDGATREKVQRFFSERQDLVPEGLDAVEVKHDPAYQHAFTVINTLRQLSKEDAGSGVTNQGDKTDELEIQAAERQQNAGFQVSARMNDVYEALDDLGNEIARRFLVQPITPERTGYREINAFRQEMNRRNIPIKKYGEIGEDGRFKYLQVKTNRAAGDGSESSKRSANQALMGWLGLFPPEAQEAIKRRVVMDLTRDPDFARSVVPFERKPDPDQVARARGENTAALTRGITGFVPERAIDDLDVIHIQEHAGALDAHIAMGREQQYFTQSEGKGFEALATHQMVHIQSFKGSETNPEQANEAFQALQGQTREAEALIKQGQQKVENDKVDPLEVKKLEQADRALDQKDREQASLDADRQRRAGIDQRSQAVDEVTSIAKTAQDGAALVQQAQQAQTPQQ